MIDQVGGRLHHAARNAARAKSAPLAAECDQMFVAAAIALDAQEPVFQPAALQVIFKLLADELGQVAT